MMTTKTDDRANGAATDATASGRPTVVELITRVMADVQAVGKNQRNNEQHYNFRGIDAVVNAVGPALRVHGVLVMPMLEESAWRDVRTSRDKPARECTVKVRYRFYGPAGDHIDAVVPGESMDFGDKGAAKAMSVAYRIALLQALCIPTDEPDADSQTYERSHSRDEHESFERAVPDAPTAEQVALYDELAKQIAAAKAEPVLRMAWDSIKAAFGKGDITQAQGNELRAALNQRITILKSSAEAVST